METVRKLRALKPNWMHMMIISFIFHEVIVGGNEVLVNKIEVLVSDKVSMHCYTNESIDIQWHFNSVFNLVYAGRRLRGSYWEIFRTEYDNGTYILIIPKVRIKDAGWYYCSEEHSARRISSTHLTVLYSNPVCDSNMHPEGFIGPNTCNLQQENMIFNCVVSFNGSFPPHLIWRLLNDNRTLNSSICVDKPNRRNCSLILKSDPIYDGSMFICQTTASIDSKFNCSTEAIKILYFSSTNDTTKKYVNDNIYCSANSNLNVKYNWTVKQNNKAAYLSSKQNIVIQKPGVYLCEVNYSIRNYSCLSIAYVMNVSVESTNVEKTSGTTVLVLIILSIGFVLVLLLVGVISFMLKLREAEKREKRRGKYARTENRIFEDDSVDSEKREEDERIKNEGIENTRIREKIEGMYKDFVLRVNPNYVLELLIQKEIISAKVSANVLNKETKADNCRALLDHLSSSSHRDAFIVLKKALVRYYPSIVTQIDTIDDSSIITSPENERVKDKVVSTYIDFTSEVDPKNIFDHLIQNRIVNLEEKRELMNKDSVKERCRALIDHLFFGSKENAFIVLREALKEPYPRIVESIDASGADNEAEVETVTGKQENAQLRNRMIAIYEEFVSEVDPEKVFDFLTQNKIVNLKQRHYLKNKGTTEDQCEALLDFLFSCSKDNAFIILKKALKEHYPRMVERIDTPTIDDVYQNNFDNRSKIRLESSTIVFGADYGRIDAFKINLNRPVEVSAMQQLLIRVGSFMASAVYCDSVFVTGIGENSDEIWRFDARKSKWNKCAPFKKGRFDHSVAFVEHILYICGGHNIFFDNALDDVQAYDAIDDKCTTVGKLEYAVEHAGNCVPYKASLYIFGGLNVQHKALNSVQVYNTKLNSCTILTRPMPRNEAFLCVALFKKHGILLGEGSCFVYNFDTETWDVRDKFKTDVQCFDIAVYNEKLFIIGGRDSKQIHRDDVRYVPILNILNDDQIEWIHHAKLPKPFKVCAFGNLEFLVKQI